MDIQLNSNQPCCSKSLFNSLPSGNSDEIIVIDDSGDSDYGTSSFARSSNTSSPTCKQIISFVHFVCK